jgi:hypothetical protein
MAYLNGISMGRLAIALQWFCFTMPRNGFTVALNWRNNGLTMASQWHHNSLSMDRLAIESQRIGSQCLTMASQWPRNGITMAS